MNQIKVLIVDDSSLMRKLITKMVDDDPEIIVIDTAMNGLFALKKLEKLQPDVILLDIEMPEMNGIDFLKECNRLNIKIPIIILSSIGKNRPEVTIKCMDLGAKDFIIKPSGAISLDIEKVQKEIISKIKYFYRESGKSHIDTKQLENTISKYLKKEQSPEPNGLNTKQNIVITKSDSTAIEKKLKSIPSIDIITIGISTGGPHALRKILPTLPEDFPVPILIVQHMPAGFTTEFAHGLNDICKLRVKEAENQDPIETGTIYIAPGSYHIRVKMYGVHNIIDLDNTSPVNGHKPSAEPLYLSASEVYGNRMISVIMTGMGKDGANAIKIVRSRGAYTIAQDEKSSVIFGMPRSAIEIDAIDEVLSLDDIPKRIIEITTKINSHK